MSQAENIATAAIDALTVPPMTNLPANSVQRDPVDPTQRSLLPVLVVEPGDEPPPVEQTIGRVMRSLSLNVTAVAAGSAGAATAEAIIEETHQRLMDDRTLASTAWDVVEAETLRRRDELDMAVYAVTKRYIIKYITDRGVV